MNYTFASDNTAGICPEAFAALSEANQGHMTSYGEDAWTARAKEAVQDVFETDCEVFFVTSGTVANALSMAALCRNYQSVLCHRSAHLDTDEGGAAEFFTGGSKVITLPGTPGGKLLPDEVEAAMSRPHGVNVHYPRPAAISVTQSTEFGQVYTPADLQALSAAARDHGLALQMDGARFANAVAGLEGRKIQPADLTWRAGVDVLSFGGSKNGMHSTEAVVFFNRALAKDFICRIKQSGQLAAKQRFAAAQWVGMLRDGVWLRHARHANAMARRLAAGFATLSGCELQFPVEANGVFIKLPQALAAGLAAKEWKFYPFYAENVYRLMCGWDTPASAVDALIADARTVSSHQ
jgi:threonine aldolase